MTTPARNLAAMSVLLASTVGAGCSTEISVRPRCGETRYEDLDGDGYGNRDVTLEATPDKDCKFPAGWVADANDCHDQDPDLHPETVWYADTDEDGYGDPAVTAIGCNQDFGWVRNDQDCDDRDDTVHPDTVWYADTDEDGYGDSNAVTYSCEPPPLHQPVAGDCDDTDPQVNPDGIEVCDGIDNDCDTAIDGDDGSLDPATSTAHYPDSDNDTYGDDTLVEYSCEIAHPPGYVGIGGDCDDADPAVNPSAQEICFTGDDDCDGLVNDADPSVIPADSWYPDADGDGFGDPANPALACTLPPGHTIDSSDCDDSDPNAYPGAAPTDHPTACMADVDQDGFGDDSPAPGVTPGTDCDDTDADAFPGAAPNDNTYLCMRDGDGDDWGDAAAAGPVVAGTDCNDALPGVSPGADELCATVYDDDCDGQVNESSAVDAVASYFDGDADGYGRGAPIFSCIAAPGTSPVDGDCDDTDPAVNPGEVETCNSVDDDCNGVVDDDYAVDALDWFEDQDDDGFGSMVASLQACTNPDPAVYSNTPTDCDDGNDAVFPGAVEMCDGIQNDCDLVGWTDAAEDGLVSLEAASGAWSDATTAYDWTNQTVPTGYSVGTAGTLWFCRGDHYGRIVVSNPIAVTIEGRYGAVDTRLHGSALSGAIELNVPGTDATIRGLTIQDGGAPYGGGIEARDGTLLIEDCDIRNNSSTQAGGAVVADNLSSFVVTGTLFEGNTAESHGGAIWAVNGTDVQVDTSTFRNNATLDLGRTGGGIHAATGASWTVVDSVFEGNIAQHGGALAAESTAGPSSTQNTSFLNNVAVTEGGAVRTMIAYTDIGSTFDSNQALEGGAIALVHTGANTLSASVLMANTAGTGGAIRIEGAGSGLLDLDSVQLLDNIATTKGGAISVLDGDALLTSTDVLRNEAPANAGSGVHLEVSTLQAVTCDFGTGPDDNLNADDVFVPDVGLSFTYGAAATFFCDPTGC